MPQMPLRQQPPVTAEHEFDGDGETGERQQGSDVVAAIERMHRVFGLGAVNDAHADDAGDQIDRLDDQREENPLDSKNRIESGAEDHGADILRSGGFKDVRAAAGAVADIVSDQVGDDGRVARVVLGDSGFDLADQVGAHVGGLGVDAAAKLGEEGDEGSAKSEAYQLVGGLLRVLQSAEDQEEQSDAEQGE